MLMVAMVTRWFRMAAPKRLLALFSMKHPRDRSWLRTCSCSMRIHDIRTATTSGSPLPRNWGTTEFASHVQRQGLAIVTAESFSVGESRPNAVRVSLGAASSRAELVRALEVLATALRGLASKS